MDVIKFYLEEPKRKRFGWSHYNEFYQIIEKENDKNGECIALIISEYTLPGKKLCLFNKFIWDYKFYINNFKNYIV